MKTMLVAAFIAAIAVPAGPTFASTDATASSSRRDTQAFNTAQSMLGYHAAQPVPDFQGEDVGRPVVAPNPSVIPNPWANVNTWNQGG